MSMYELASEYLALLEYADSDDPEERQVFLDTLEGLKGEIGCKADNCANIITVLQSRVNAIDAEIERLERRKNATSNSIGNIKMAIRMAMEVMGTTKVQTDTHTFTIQKNGGKQPMEITGDVPDNYKRIIYEIDRERIRTDLEQGMVLPFAHLDERGTHLRIR